MKKTILLTAILLAGNLLSAQNISAIATASSSPNMHQTIVRDWDGSMVFSVAEMDTNNYFCLAPVGTILTSSYPYSTYAFFKKFPKEYRISDVFIDRDTAYYCGFWTDSVHHYGFYGYMSLNNYSSSNPNFDRIDSTYELTNLVSYRDTLHQDRVVAIGKYPYNTRSTTYYGDAIVDVTNATLYSPNINILKLECGYTPASGFLKEVAFDIELTQNKVVVVGSRRQLNSNQPITLRVADRDDVSNNRFTNTYRYPYNNDEVNHGIVSTVLANKQHIAVAYIHYENTVHKYTTRVHVIDIEGVLGQMIRSREYEMANKYEPLEMIYVPQDSILVIIQDDEIQGPLTRYFFTLRPYDIGDQIYPKYETPQGCYSMDGFQNDYFVSVTNNLWFLQRPTLMGLSQCCHVENYKTFELTPAINRHSTRSLVYDSYNLRQYYSIYTPVLIPITKTCPTF